MSKFEPGSWVWINDPEEVYLPAKVLTAFESGTATTVCTEDGDKIKLDTAISASAVPCNTEALDVAIQDLCNISDLNEMSILHSLRIRFKQDFIYTNVSTILISVNPFKQLPIYTPQILENYRANARDLPPHIFGTASMAYDAMTASGHDQAVVISGESGAGKSEATKLILQFLAEVSYKGADTGASSATGSLEQQILAANPILEAFGNAKTLRNNNSSRFGKLITVNFDSNSSILGGVIINYLLEKSRVVFQMKGERNYHIFYQLLSAAESFPTLAEELKLQSPEMFNYLNQSGVVKIEGLSDYSEFEDVLNAMRVLNFSEDEKLEVFRIVTGVLYFGNVKFNAVKSSTADEASEIADTDALQHACKLWGVSADKMKNVLVSKNIGTREVVLVPYSVNQAIEARDAMVKRVYIDLFQIIVNRINTKLSVPKARKNFIGVLDIFGFESFEVNSFEQLCINYCNEKLQFYFNEHIFKMEQSLYSEEGITISSSAFVDNQPTLDLLEAKAVGIFGMIDEEINVPRGSDDSLLTKIFQKYDKNPILLRPKAKDCKDHMKNFGIQHYAGSVFYNVTNFLEKNKDQLHGDIVQILSESSNNILKSVYNDDSSKSTKPGGKKLTLGFQFKQQLADLINTLNSAHSHFVRCMKSNDRKQGNIFEASRMRDQLRYAGLVEVCRIRKLGYPLRRAFDDFFRRYRPLDLTAPNLAALIGTLEKKNVLTSGEWAKGKTKIFMRTQQSLNLELAREASLTIVARVIQRYARGFIFFKRFKFFKEVIADVHKANAKRDIDALSKALEKCAILPWGGNHLKYVIEAKSILARLREEARVLKLLENALAANEINGLKSSVAVALNMSPPYSHPLVKQAEEVIVKLESEIATKAELLAAINSRDLSSLSAAISNAQKINYSSIELQQATSLYKKIEEENTILANLSSAVASNNLQTMVTLISKCLEMGLSDRPEVVNAQKVQAANAKSLEMQAAMEEAQAKRRNDTDKVLHKLRLAMGSNDKATIELALQEALDLSINAAEVQMAKSMMQIFEMNENIGNIIRAELQSLNAKLESGLLPKDLTAFQSAVDTAGDMDPRPAEYEEAFKSLNLFVKLANANKGLIDALAKKDRLKLRSALDAAENLDMSLEIVSQVRTLLRGMEEEFRAERAAKEIDVTEDTVDEFEEARGKRHEMARQVRFDIKNFAGLRTPDDYAKSFLLKKSKVKEGFLSFQNDDIPKSLTLQNSTNTKHAIQLFKNLLGYCGDKHMPFPAMLARDILKVGFEKKELRDEIYMQLIKQTHNNSRVESYVKVWQLMSMCTTTFPPSYDFEHFLTHFLLNKCDNGDDISKSYAKYCLRTLDSILFNGDGTGFVPSQEEIQAYNSRPPVLISIYLVDGNPIIEDFPVSPDVDCSKLVEMCIGWLDLKDPRVDTLGLFAYDLGELGKGLSKHEATKNMKRTPRPLRNKEFLGDLVLQKIRHGRKFKLVLKKKIFPVNDELVSDDPYYQRLVYLQAEEEAIYNGTITVESEEKVVHLASMSMAIAYGDEMGSDAEQLSRGNILDFILPAWRASKRSEEWAALVASIRDQVVAMDIVDLQDEFLNIVRESPLYGYHWFHGRKLSDSPEVQELPTDLILAYGITGLYIHDQNYHCIRKVAVKDIQRWGGSSTEFALVLTLPATNKQYELRILSPQAPDQSSILSDIIEHLMSQK